MDAFQAEIVTEGQSLSLAQSDEILVQLAKADSAHFVVIYRRYVNPVYQYCDRCLRHREDAEEATQITFLRALESLDRCREPALFRSWLFAIAHNAIIDLGKKRNRTVTLDNQVPRASTAPSVEDEAMATFERDLIHELLASLPPEQRQVIELRLQGLSGKEIAAALGKSDAAIRSAQYRGVRSIQSQLLASRKESANANP